MDAPLPSGEQFEIVAGDYRAVAVEAGGGLRELTYAGRPLVEGYPPEALADGGRGQVLAPWPNRVRDGRWTWEGRELQLALSEPATGNASHGLVRWAGWGATERALRRGEPLPSSRVAPVVAVGTSAVGALVLLGLVLT